MPRRKKEVTPKEVEEAVVNETVETAVEAAPEAEAVPAEDTPVEAAVEEKPKKRGRKAASEKKAGTKKAAAEKKTDTKKAAKAEKTTKPGRPAKPAREIETTVHVQYAGRTFEPDKIVTAAKEAWIAKGHRTTSIKTLELYINVAENKAYPVINGEPQDGFDC